MPRNVNGLTPNEQSELKRLRLNRRVQWLSVWAMLWALGRYALFGPDASGWLWIAWSFFIYAVACAVAHRSEREKELDLKVAAEQANWLENWLERRRLR